jgi:hypothetical protein
MSDDEFADDFGSEAPRSAPRPGKKKKKGQASKSGKTPSGKASDKPAGPSQKEKVQLYILVGVFLLAVIPFAIFMAIRQGRMEDAEKAAFAAEIDQLLQPPKDGAAPPGKPGKFAEVDVNKRELYVYHGNLGVDMRAVTPAEADYIVQVNETRETVAEYTDGSKGIKVTLELTVIDKPTWTVLDRKTFVGDDPPLVAFGSSGDVVKQPERDEVKAYYKSLVGME